VPLDQREDRIIGNHDSTFPVFVERRPSGKPNCRVI